MVNVSVKVKRKTSVTAGKKMPLFLQVICNRKVKRIVLALKVTEDEWQQDIGTVAIPSHAGNKRVEELLDIRETLEQDLKEMDRVIDFLNEKDDCTAERIIKGFQLSKRCTLWLEYIQLVIEKKKEMRAETTIRNYQSSYKAFYEFCNGEDMPVRDIDEDVIMNFEKYLQMKGISKNTIAFYCRNLKAVWNTAVREHIVEHRPSPFRNINTRIEKTEKRAIKEKYIHKLKELNIENSPGLSLARDLFLFCFFVRGMTFVDLAYLTPANIHGNQLIYVRKKTGQVLKVELLPVMLKIIRKYHVPGQYYLFPILKNKDASWKEYDSALRLQNKRLKIIGDQIGTHLSTYVARHSWASIAKQKGISEEIISDCMGHTSMDTTRIYIASLDNSKLDRANRIVITRKEHIKSHYKNKVI